MSVLMLIVGAIALILGIGMVGFGIPINEFSFGNTLIEAGTTAASCGLVLIGLGAVVAQLQRIADGLAMWTPARPASRMAEMFESGTPIALQAAPAQAAPAAAVRPPFPPKPPARPKVEAKSEAKPEAKPEVKPETKPNLSPELQSDTPQRAATPVESPVSFVASSEPPPAERFSAAPSLHNPDVPPIETGKDVSLSPAEQPPASAEIEEPPPAPRPRFGFGSGMNQRRQDATPESAWRPSPPPPPPDEIAPLPAASQPQESSHFDDMWPAFDPKSDRQAAADDGKSDPMLDLPPPREKAPEPAAEAEPPMPDAAPSGPPRAVAILKSGVVDGMGYTLYVDGSIEAELPQGTLRFSSINDLRNYLEKNA